MAGEFLGDHTYIDVRMNRENPAVPQRVGEAFDERRAITLHAVGTAASAKSSS